MADGASLTVPKTIVLVGLMGAGKSFVGRRLARRLGLAFVDADQRIEEAAGCSIAEIFERYGETAFRDGERRVICRLLDDPVHVLASGGGAFMDAELREKIRARGISIWLRAELGLLVSRVTRKRSARPLIAGGEVRDVLSRLIAERYPVYAEADIVVDSLREPGDKTVERVVDALARHLGRDPPPGARQRRSP